MAHVAPTDFETPVEVRFHEEATQELRIAITQPAHFLLEHVRDVIQQRPSLAQGHTKLQIASLQKPSDETLYALHRASHGPTE